jgi:tetratricopeptide (TPR) repeat protein
VNQLGYEFLQRGQLDAAITVLELNVESYPGSANTYDSLAEAHLESGDRERAIALYTRATEVDPEFENARRMLRQLTEGDAHTAAEGH